MVVVSKRGRFMVAEPLFEPGERLTLSGGSKVKPGQMALVQTGGRRNRVLRALGRPDAALDVVEAMMLDRGVRRGFGKGLKAEAAEATDRAGSAAGKRRDLTAMPTLTVDPATARDFDDAVSASESGDGIRLWIHIADVAAHISPGSGLDQEALRRGNSIYVPGSVEPMLPLALSADACSLSPGVERLAVTAEIELGPSGETRSVSFYRSTIRSDARLDYDQLDEIFAGRARPPGEVAEPLALARRPASAAAALRASASGSATSAGAFERPAKISSSSS